LPKVRIDDGFDPNTYKLMKKSGYDFNKPVSLRHVMEAKLYSINKTQKKIQEQGVVVTVPKVGISQVSSQRVRISRRHNDKHYLAQHITAEEIIESDEKDVKDKPKSIVFDRLQSSTSRGRTSAFDRVGNDKISKSCTFWTLKVSTQPKPSVSTRIKSSEELASLSSTQERAQYLVILAK